MKESKVYLSSRPCAASTFCQGSPTPKRGALFCCFFFFLYKAGAKRHKDVVFVFFSRCLLPIHVEVQPRMLPRFLVFQDELSSASFLGRPPASSSPLDGSSTAAESCFIGGWGVRWGGSVCRAATGSAVMNRRESSTVSQGRSRFFFLPGSIAA